MNDIPLDCRLRLSPGHRLAELSHFFQPETMPERSVDRLDEFGVFNFFETEKHDCSWQGHRWTQVNWTVSRCLFCGQTDLEEREAAQRRVRVQESRERKRLKELEHQLAAEIDLTRKDEVIFKPSVSEAKWALAKRFPLELEMRDCDWEGPYYTEEDWQHIKAMARQKEAIALFNEVQGITP